MEKVKCYEESILIVYVDCPACKLEYVQTDRHSIPEVGETFKCSECGVIFKVVDSVCEQVGNDFEDALIVKRIEEK